MFLFLLYCFCIFIALTAAGLAAVAAQEIRWNFNFVFFFLIIMSAQVGFFLGHLWVGILCLFGISTLLGMTAVYQKNHPWWV